VEALTFDEFLILTAIAYIPKSNTRSSRLSFTPTAADLELAALGRSACAHSEFTDLTAKGALESLYGSGQISKRLNDAVKLMSLSVLPGSIPDARNLGRECYFENFSNRNSNTPWMRFWMLYFSGNVDATFAARVSLSASSGPGDTLGDIRKRSNETEKEIDRLAHRIGLAGSLAAALARDLIPFGSVTSVIAERMSSDICDKAKLTRAGISWTTTKLSQGLQSLVSLVNRSGFGWLKMGPGVLADANILSSGADYLAKKAESDAKANLKDNIEEKLEDRLEKFKSSTAALVAGFKTRFGTIDSAERNLPEGTTAGENKLVSSVKSLILLAKSDEASNEALLLFESRACAVATTGAKVSTSSDVNGPLVALAATGIVSAISSVEEALDISMEGDNDEEKSHNPSPAETKAKAEAEKLLGKAIDAAKANAVKATLVICRAEVEDAGRRAHVIGRIMDVWKKDLETYVNIIRSIGPGLIKARPEKVIAVTQKRDKSAQRVIEGMDQVIKALKEANASDSSQSLEQANRLDIERQEKEIKNNQLILAKQQAQLASIKPSSVDPQEGPAGDVGSKSNLVSHKPPIEERNSDIIEHVNPSVSPFGAARTAHSTSATSMSSNSGSRSSRTGSEGAGIRTASSSSRTGIVGNRRRTGSSGSASWWD
jgi:hypothetical protein